MKVRYTISFESEISDDPAFRANAYRADGTGDEAILASEKTYIEGDPGYLLGFDEPWTVTVEKVN